MDPQVGITERMNARTYLRTPQEPFSQDEKETGTGGRKRRRDCEEPPPARSPPPLVEKPSSWRPVKQATLGRPAVSDRSQPLTDISLRLHTLLLEGDADKLTLLEGYLDSLEPMDPDVDSNDGSRGTKRRALTRLGSAASAGRPSLSASQVSEKTSLSASQYRLVNLKNSNILFRFRPAPEDIRARIAAIVHVEVSAEKKVELSLIAENMHKGFLRVLGKASREDDCIELLYHAMSSLGYDESLDCARKADWEPKLKPGIRPKRSNFDHLFRSEDDAEGSFDESSQRQSGDDGDEPSILPNTPEAATAAAVITVKPMGPPPIPPSVIKTPRPDISVGLPDEAIFVALETRGLSRLDAEDLLNDLEMPDMRNGGSPLLYSQPTKSAQWLRFPFLVVEGKSYATGRPIYEAQNQAAVSGACSLRILHDLEDLARKSAPGNHSPLAQGRRRQPIVMFSICTEGPIHQLWAHYTTVESGRRMYYMTIIKTSDVAIGSDVLGFLEAVDNVLRWGCGDHKETIAEQLRMIQVASFSH